MRQTLTQRLQEALSNRNIPVAVQREVLDVLLHSAPKRHKAERAFADLIQQVRQARRVVLSNKKAWHATLVPLYYNYVALLERTATDIEQASALMLKNPDDPGGPRIPATLERITAIASKRHAHALANNLPPTPLCTSYWPSWVDPAELRRTIEAFDLAYAHMGRGKGRRFVPFNTEALGKEFKRQVNRHRTFIADQRAAMADAPHGMGTTHYRALHLCALRMAELWLDHHEREISLGHKHPACDPIPVAWTHMLTPEMRKRIKEADADPSQYIDPTGLTSYLAQPEE